MLHFSYVRHACIRKCISRSIVAFQKKIVNSFITRTYKFMATASACSMLARANSCLLVPPHTLARVHSCFDALASYHVQTQLFEENALPVHLLRQVQFACHDCQKASGILPFCSRRSPPGVLPPAPCFQN